MRHNQPIRRIQRITQVVFAVLLSMFVIFQTQAQVIPLDHIVAVVNDDIISASELSNRLQMVKRQLQKNLTPLPDEPILKQQVLDHMINQRLQLQIASNLGVHVDNDTVSKAVLEITKQNNLTLQQLKDRLVKDNYSLAQFRADLHDEITIRRVQQQIHNKIKVTEKEVDNFLLTAPTSATRNVSYHLAHILLSLPDNPTPAQVKAMNEKSKTVHRALDNGKPFNEIALSYSEGQQALQGGDLGWRKLAELPTIFSNIVPTMQAGEVKGPIRSNNSIHFVQLIEKKTQKHTLQQTHARHILIRLSEITDSTTAKAKLDALRAQILAGETDFASAAKSVSDDTSSANQGGDLGWVSPGVLEPAFEAVMNKLAEQAISPSFQTPSGWHIVQVLERRSLDNSLQFQRDQVKKQIFERKVQEAMQNWLIQLRDSAHIEIRADT